MLTCEFNIDDLVRDESVFTEHENKIMEIASKKLADEIDQEILASMQGNIETPKQREKRLEKTYPTYKKVKQYGTPKQIETIRALIK